METMPKLGVGIVCAALWLTLAPPCAIAAPVIICPPTHGYVQGPFAPDRKAARHLFDVYRAALGPDYQSRAPVKIIDNGASWEMYEDHLSWDAYGRPTHLLGGGGLALTIDKCSGGVLSATNQR